MSQTARDKLEVTVGERVESVELAQYASGDDDIFYGRPGTEDSGVFQVVVDDNEYDLPAELSSEDVVIDIGAHIGSFSYAALKRGAGKVYAYEAHPINAAITRKNLSRFGDRASCRNLAVWRSDEPARTLYNDVITGYQHTGGISVLWNEQGVPVDTTSLDEILFEASNGLRKRIRLLKIDCEGSEYPILFTSRHLDIVEEICGEYHAIAPERIPERAKVKDRCEYFNGSVLKSLLERQGWVVELRPQNQVYGLFNARRAPGDARGGSVSELKVEELMGRIRASVARKEFRGEISPIDVQALLRELQAQQIEASTHTSELQLTLAQISPETELIPIDDAAHYHVNDLLKHHDKEFVRNAYRALLKREADESGFNHYLDSLRNGRYNKIDILAALRYSNEGRERNVSLRGLRLPYTLRRLYRIPALGYFLQLSVALLRLPVLVRNHSQLETYTLVQREKLLESIGTVADSVEKVADAIKTVEGSIQTVEESFKTSIKTVEDSFKALTKLQHQQISALFREQHQMLGEQKELFDLINARHALEHETRAGDSQSAMEEQVRQLAQRVEDLRAEFARQQRVAALLAEIAGQFKPDDAALREMQMLAKEDRHHLDALYASFEDQFRGDKEDVKARLRYYLPFLKEAGITQGILDMGCGRGDWLELLEEEGLAAQAVDSNSVLVERCRGRGLSVVQADALQYLRGLPDASLNAVTGFHIIEHLPFETLVQLLDEIFRLLRPGGLIMLETPSPENLVVAACNFYSDPTHNRPVSPHTLKFILKNRGFDNIGLQFLHPVEGSPFEAEDGSLHSLHMWFYGPRDYAIVGSKK
jgi:FkbM family methyltransferase